jgi:hypothetical protein
VLSLPVAAWCSFATPQAAYANPLGCCDAASRLHNGGEVAQFLHKTSYAICDASLLSHTANSRPSGRIRSFMQKSGSRISPDTPPAATRGSVMSLRSLFVPRCGKIASAKAQAGKNASGCPPARAVLIVCDCSSLSPLTLKALRSPTPCPFAAIATALLSGFAAHAEARPMVTASVASGLGLPRRQPSTMSAGFCISFDTCGAPPPSRPLRGALCRCAARKREEVLQVFLPPVF